MEPTKKGAARPARGEAAHKYYVNQTLLSSPCHCKSSGMCITCLAWNRNYRWIKAKAARQDSA
jgi:hypothetical protein